MKTSAGIFSENLLIILNIFKNLSCSIKKK